MALPTYTLALLRTKARQYSNQELGSMDEAEALVTNSELNDLINLGLRELHDLFTTQHGEEYFLKATSIQITAPRNVWELPDDLVTIKGVDYSTSPFPGFTLPDAFDDGGDNIWADSELDVPAYEKEDSVQLFPYSWEDRHRQGDQWYDDARWGDLRCPSRYRIMSINVTEGPDPGHRNVMRLSDALTGYLLVWYIPEVPLLVSDSDVMAKFHGFEEYPALFAAIQMAGKEETDTTYLEKRMAKLEARIRNMASIRDISMPEVVSDVGGQ